MLSDVEALGFVEALYMRDIHTSHFLPSSTVREKDFEL